MKIFQNKIVVGVICIVIAAILAFFFLPSISKSKSNTEKIYAVKNAVAEGTKIEESMLVEKEVGSYGLPQSIIKDKDKIVGKYASCDITPDDLILSSKLSEFAANQKLDKVMSEGKMLVTVTGGSQGGALSVACACLVPEIKKCAPCYPYLSDYKRVYEMDLNKGAYEGLKYYFRHFDPTHRHFDEIYEKLGYIDIQNIAKRMNAELLMFTGLMDTTCPPSTQFAMYNKVNSKKDVVFYPEYGHEGLKGADDIIFEFLSTL